MAKKRKVTQAFLDNALRKHDLWRYTEGECGEQAVFENLDMGGLTFWHKKIEDIKFVNVNLNRVDFSDSSVMYCIFTNCTFNKGEFTDALLMGCLFQDSTFKGALFNNTDVQQGKFNDCQFSGCNLYNATFEHSWFSAMFADCKLGGTIFFKTGLKYSEFKNTDKEKAYMLRCY